MRKTALVTGCSGLIGSEAVTFLDDRGWIVHGIDNNMRRDFFGADGDTTWNLERLRRETRRFVHHAPRHPRPEALFGVVAAHRPTADLHCAAQPSHDLAASRPFDDFEINAVGDAEPAGGGPPELSRVAIRLHVDQQGVRRRPERVAARRAARRAGTTPTDDVPGRHRRDCRIDRRTHSLVRRVEGGGRCARAGVRALLRDADRVLPRRLPDRAAPLGRRAARLPVVPGHARSARAGRTGSSATRASRSATTSTPHDVCTAIEAFDEAPRAGAVYNLGGGRANSVSILEAAARFEELIGAPLATEYVDEPRRGDHICYISNLAHFRAAYPAWGISRSLDDIFDQLADEPIAA